MIERGWESSILYLRRGEDKAARGITVSGFHAIVLHFKQTKVVEDLHRCPSDEERKGRVGDEAQCPRYHEIRETPAVNCPGTD